ncbi:hotdog domain-containing protein [Pseudonocardia endophytica]|uniref:Uncharacterized protein (TIGR00369 family) n=1 Tax=Pseudonocardia endophytica TaxID=401976 RepID=A0A4R1HP81_PSEEN|nr:hotdog domain-containing protein [Pseudonocardia endophytica]TCK22943.1 uncharacterized protein (TIGR00369 family) [Pseudonocardia endophytica]
MTATEAAPLPPSGPDRLFRVGPLRPTGPTTVEASMRCGPWTVGPDGRPGLASLCVLLDAVLGQATIAGRPEGMWPVTTEMTVDLTGAVPDEGEVTVRAWVIGSAGHSIVARGDMLGPDGSLIGVATEWGRLIPEVPDVGADDPGSDVVPPGGDAAAVLGAYVVVGAPARAAGEVRPTLTLPGSPALANERDTMHGGILATAAELAAVAVVPGSRDRPMATGSLHVTYLRPALMDGPTTVRTDVVHQGRSFAVVRSDVRNAAGKLAAAATVTRRALD